MHGGGGEGVCSELIHLYCLSPLVEISEKFLINKYSIAANKVLNFYKSNYMDEIIKFKVLSHFYAYIVEALVDMGETELAKKCMENIVRLQNHKGAIPAYEDVKWICSTGVFQFSVIWFKLGELERGNKAFRYACSLQNMSGGWFGSYGIKFGNKLMKSKKHSNYFIFEEISWANKYFLDALFYKTQLEFENMSAIFMDSIDKNDGRYKLILDEINKNNAQRIADIGCGKGRYLKNLIEDTKSKKFYAVDISFNVMEKIDNQVERSQGTLINIPYADESFDFVYTVEALEHAIDINNSIESLYRVTSEGGTIVIIDKNKTKLGKLKIDDWEQWFDDMELCNIIAALGGTVKIIKNIPYEGHKDGLFNAWIITKK